MEGKEKEKDDLEIFDMKDQNKELENTMKSIKAFCLFITVLLFGIAGFLVIDSRNNKRRFDELQKNDEILLKNDSIQIQHYHEINCKFYGKNVLLLKEDFCSCSKEFVYKHISKGCKK